MPEITCPAQGCTQTFRDDLPEAVLTQLISIHAQSVHPVTTPPQQNLCAKMERVRRPTISSAGTSEDWDYFLGRWQEYKLATRLRGQDILTQLLECADDDLRKDLSRAYGSLLNETEDNALKKIKTLAVKPENILVARVNLHNLTQDRAETVRGFAARLKGQAKVCQFSKQKTCICDREVEIDYSEDIIRDTLIRGLADEEIQLDVLAQCNQNLTLDETILMAEAKESGKRSAGMLTNTAVSMNAASTYKKNVKQKFTVKPQNSFNDAQPKPCGHCGKSGHSWKRYDRKKHCAAFNHQCTNCGIMHHFESMCRTTQQRSTSQYQHNRNKPTTNNVVSHDYMTETSENNSFFNGATFDELLTASESVI